MNATPAADESVSANRHQPTYVHLGIDGAGAAHCWHTDSNSVHVIAPDGTREKRVSITDTEFVADVDHYVVEIGARRDWTDLQYGFEAFVDRLAEAV
jgi:hypothetical protein